MLSSSGFCFFVFFSLPPSSRDTAREGPTEQDHKTYRRFFPSCLFMHTFSYAAFFCLSLLSVERRQETSTAMGGKEW